MIDTQYIAHQPVEHAHRKHGLQQADKVVWVRNPFHEHQHFLVALDSGDDASATSCGLSNGNTFDFTPSNMPVVMK